MATASATASSFPSSSATETTATTTSTIVQEATIERVKQAEDDLARTARGIDADTPLVEAGAAYNSAALALEIAWLNLLNEAKCLSEERQSDAVAKLTAYTTALQTDLQVAGYDPGPIDGVYGPETVAAVQKLQTDSGLPVTGLVDEATARALQGQTGRRRPEAGHPDDAAADDPHLDRVLGRPGRRSVDGRADAGAEGLPDRARGQAHRQRGRGDDGRLRKGARSGEGRGHICDDRCDHFDDDRWHHINDDRCDHIDDDRCTNRINDDRFTIRIGDEDQREIRTGHFDQLTGPSETQAVATLPGRVGSTGTAEKQNPAVHPARDSRWRDRVRKVANGDEEQQSGRSGRGTRSRTQPQPYVREATDVVADLGSDPSSGLTRAEAAARLARYGPNQITGEKPPSILVVALSQLRDPMNIMLIVVTAVSFVIGQVSTGVIVGLLILLNVVLASRQELKARASVDALSNLQVPQAKVVRGGGLVLVPAVEVVPGDLVQVEAGDIVPADGRIVRSATLEAQEAALTGESAPVPKDSAALPAGDVPLGDRSNMLFQNTSVTRGTASMVVTGTGMNTQMGQIATMLTSVTRTRSPLQKELDTLTRVLGIIAWAAVAFIVVVGLVRGVPAKQLLLLGTAMAISAIPTGLPAFVSGMLSYGAKQLAAAKAVVKNLTDVETLGATSAINTDKTGTLTMNQMMVSTIYANGSWFTVEGAGYGKTGAILSVAGIAGAGLQPVGVGAGAGQRRDGRGRRGGGRRPDRGGAGGAVRQAGRGRRGDPAGLPAGRRGAVRFRVQVHGHLSPRAGRPGRSGHRVGQGRPGRGAGPLHPVRWPVERLAGADRPGPRGYRGGERPDGREGSAGAGLRGPPGRGRRDAGDDRRSDVVDPRPGVRGDGGHHRSAADRGEGGRGRRVEGRHRRADDHRRPCGHRQGDRRDPGPRARARSAAPSCRRCPTTS